MSKFKPPPITTADRLTLTPEAGEFMFDSDLNTYWGGDGSTVGGIPIGSGGGSASWTDVTVSDANFTAANDTRYYLPAGVLTANRDVNMSAITTKCMFVIAEDADVHYLSFTTTAVYGQGGATAFTQIAGLGCTTIEKISTKLIQTA